MSPHDKPDLQSAAHPGSGHETTDISIRPLLTFVIGLVVFLTMVLLVLRGQFSFYEKEQSLGQITPGPLPPLTDAPTAEPKLQEAPALEMDELRARDRAELDSLGWVDRPKGTAKIPIDDAMRLLVAKGLPTRKRGGPPLDQPPGAPGSARGPHGLKKENR